MLDLLLYRGAELLVWMESHAAMTAAVAAALLVPGAICCWAARRSAAVSRQALTRIEDRLAHICSAVELLTDTTEAGLQTAFGEIERLSAESGARAARRAGLPTRLKQAARDGRTAREIAQSEGVSEGEVRLRLRLKGDAAADMGELPVLQ